MIEQIDLTANAAKFTIGGVVAFVIAALLQFGIFATKEDVANIQTEMAQDYATKQDVQEIKRMLNRIEERVYQLPTKRN